MTQLNFSLLFARLYAYNILFTEIELILIYLSKYENNLMTNELKALNLVTHIYRYR